MLDGLQVPAWLAAAIDGILAQDEVRIVVLAWRDPPPGTHGPLAYRLYRRFEKLLFRPRPNAFARTDVAALVAGIPAVHIVPPTANRPDPLAALAAYRPDVLVQFGPAPFTGPFVDNLPHGLWHFDATAHDGVVPVLCRAPSTTAALVDDRGRTLYRFCTRTHRLSVRHNRNMLYWRKARAVPRALARLRADAAAEPAPAAPTQADAPLGNARFCSLLWRHLGRVLHMGLDNLCRRSQWILLHRSGTDWPASPAAFTRLVPPADRTWADPFVVRYQDRDYVFIEELVHRKKNAHLAVFALGPDDRPTRPRPVLQRPYHLSYPFVFAYQDTYYMIPETASNRAIELYRCTDFPDRWVFERALMQDVRAADTTLFFYEGRWWLWTALADGPGGSTRDELFLFYGDAPTGTEWTPHPLNPVVTDIHRARPAGRVFARDGQLYRPSQDCSVRYGYALNLNRITELTPDRYREEPVAALRPDAGLIALHTFNSGSGHSFIDGKIRRWRFFGA